MKIDFGEPILKNIKEISVSDLDDFYVYASETDRLNLFFVLLASAIHYRDRGEFEDAAHLFYLISYYLFVPLTPPASCELASHFINKAIELNDISEYRDWLAIVQSGN